MTAHDLKIACPSYKMLSQGSRHLRALQVRNACSMSCATAACAIRSSASAVVAVESGLHRRLKHLAASHLRRHRLPEPVLHRQVRRVGLAERAQLRGTCPTSVDATASLCRAVRARCVTLLYFGRLALDKGVATLIRAAHAGRRARSSWPARGRTKRLLKRAWPQALRRRLSSSPATAAGQALHDAGARRALRWCCRRRWYENAPMMRAGKHGPGQGGASARGSAASPN